MSAYRKEIAVAAANWRISPDLLEAQVLVESNARTDAFRFEPAFFERYLKGKAEWADWNPRRAASSYGLLQVMFPTARDMGFGGPPEMLFIPDVGLEWGARYLHSLLVWAAGDYTRAFCAYNGGKGAVASLPYRTQAYADKVFAMFAKLKTS